MTNNAINVDIPVPVNKGGTGVATLTTAYGVLCAGTTATADVQTLASLGSATHVLTSNGAGALPSFQAATGGSGTFNVAEVTLTNSQIKNLVATPVQILAAQGSGVTTHIFRWAMKLNAGSEALTQDSDVLQLTYTDAAGSDAAIDLPTDFLDGATDQIIIGGGQTSETAAATAFENQVIVLFKAAGAEIGGNASNDATLKVAIWYTTISL